MTQARTGSLYHLMTTCSEYVVLNQCLHRKDSGAALEVTEEDTRQGGTDWQFYQPFAGGTVFVSTQVRKVVFVLQHCWQTCK